MKEISAEPRVTQEMIIEEIKMPAGKPVNLGERVVHELRVERTASREEAVLVAEGAMMRTASRDDNRIRDQVSVSLNQIAPYRRQTFQGTKARLVAASWCSCRRSFKNWGNVCSPGPIKIVSACGAASSGREVT